MPAITNEYRQRRGISGMRTSNGSSTIKRITSKIKDVARKFVRGDLSFQTKPPAGYSYLRGRLVKSPKR